MTHHRIIPCIAFIAFIPLVRASCNAADAVDYLRDIKPVLKARCYGCHGALKQKSGLRLDTGALIRKGGDSGSATAGPVDKSVLFERLTDSDEDLRMPPEGKPLTADELRKIKAWLAGGARSPKDEQPEEDPRAHWAFRKPVRPAVPALPLPASACCGR